MEFNTNVKTGDVKISTPETPTAEVKTETVKKEPDLITRVSEVKVEEPKKEDKTPEDADFDLKELEAIKDPVAKEQAWKAYKSFQRGFNMKYQDLANLRKDLEKQKQVEGWTPQRIQQLLNDPQFVNAAQQVVQTQNPKDSGLTDEEYSALSEKEKHRLQSLEAEIQKMKEINIKSMFAQQDQQLKGKYANYDAQAVDIMTAELLQGKYQATREDIWKVYDYEPAIRRAYELGRKDGSGQLQDKTQSVSTEGGVVTKSSDAPQPEKGESNLNYFRRLVMNNLKKAPSEQIRK